MELKWPLTWFKFERRAVFSWKTTSTPKQQSRRRCRRSLQIEPKRDAKCLARISQWPFQWSRSQSSSQRVERMKMCDVYWCYRISLNSIKYFHFISFHLRCGTQAGMAQMPMSLLQTESSNHVDWYTLSNWIFLLTFFLIKINHFVFDFQTFISFVWIYETRIDTNEPPHSMKPQNLINEICVRVRADAQCSLRFVIVSNV